MLQEELFRFREEGMASGGSEGMLDAMWDERALFELE
jgi:hypothetical protein